MTDRSKRKPFPLGELRIDGGCRHCRVWAARLGGVLGRMGVEVAHFDDGAGAEEMELGWHDGRMFGGADAVVFMAGRVWWARPLGLAAVWVPGVLSLLRMFYRYLAARRHCGDGAGACGISTASGADGGDGGRTGWIVLLALSGAAMAFGSHLESWQWMWCLAAAMWLGFKLMALFHSPALRGGRGVAYWLWPGMDARAFAGPGRGLGTPDSMLGSTEKAEEIDRRGKLRPKPVVGRAPRPSLGECVHTSTSKGSQPEIRPSPGVPGPIPGMLRAGFGVWVIWGLAPAVESPVAAGWCGMAGLLLLLHFGLFDVLAVVWNRLGIPLRPIMDAPWRAGSLAEFWGRRWNRAFSDVTRMVLFRPLVRRFGGSAGTLAGFAFSGLAHELVITVPARAGYGLPTAYFLVQGAGVLLERRLGLAATSASRLWVAVVVLSPAFWLFPPAFMTGVIVPMLKAIGSR